MSSHSFNLSSTYPSCPQPITQPLPFIIDEMAFSEWLKTLTKEGEITKCLKILQVLQALNNDYPPTRNLIPGRTRLFFLEKMGLMLIAATTMLTALPNTSDSLSESPDNESVRNDLSVWSTLELADGYALFCQDDAFKGDEYYTIEEKTSILSNGIQAMGRSLLYIFQTYTKPVTNFWHRCFQFYRHAQLNRLTDSEFNPGARTIDNAFKRVLVFALSNTNQFSPSEMRTIYDLLGLYAENTGLLKSVPQKKFKGIPSIHLRGNSPPLISNENSENPDPDRLYIATVIVASNILEATYDKRTHYVPTDRLMLLRLAKTLTLNEQRKDPREPAEGNHLGIMDFDNIINFLRSKEIEQQNFLAQAGYFDPSRPGELRELNFEITPTDGKHPANLISQPTFQVEFTDTSEIWKNNQQTPPHKTNMHLVDKSPKGFGLLWTDHHVRPKVGSIIGIMNKNLTIGLIRWLAQSKETGMFMGVELMGENASFVKVSNPGYPNNEVYAILLPGREATKQPTSLILMNKDFRPNEFIFIHKNHRNARYRLTKQLHLTSFINHVEVIRSH
jgi:hypothetical protein